MVVFVLFVLGLALFEFELLDPFRLVDTLRLAFMFLVVAAGGTACPFGILPERWEVLA